MKTAEAIIIALEIAGEGASMFTKYRDKPSLNMDEVERIVYEAQKEAIEECAERARTRTNDESTSIIVDKQSILSLINELK